MKKMNTKILSIILMLCISLSLSGCGANAFEKAFKQGNLALKLIDFPGTENIQWISLSPKGSYLFGYKQEVGYGLYDVVKQQFTLLTLNTVGDTYGKLVKAMKRLPKGLEVIWSPDERHFTLSNYYDNSCQFSYLWDLFLGDTQTKEIRILQTWRDKIKSGDCKVAVATCFSADGRSLYYILKEFLDQGREVNTYKYELATGKNTPIFECFEYLDNWGSEDKYFFSFNDKSFLQSALTLETGRVLHLVHFKDEKWDRTYLKINSLFESAIPNPFRITRIDEQRLAVIFWDRANSNWHSLLLHINKENQFEYLADTHAMNIVPSHDGRYLLSMRQTQDESGSAYSLWVSKTTDQYSGRPNEVKVTLPSNISTDDFFLLDTYEVGMQWGGNLVLLSPTKVCSFNLEPK